ncbi:MAG: PilZ domain-containing protein [Deltaproteobacteria bacterium]|nr:PilZ domain-containing protein [Deltaproteobacteria bacterium]
MKYQKAYIKEDNKVEIQCPSCMKKRILPVDKVPQKYWFTVKCSCGFEFVVQRELRAKYRKNVHLTGMVSSARADKGSKWGKALNESVDSTFESSCMIINISPIGVGVFLTGHSKNRKIKEGDVLLVQFNLDNSASTKIEKMVTVKAVKNNYIGCEFFDDDKEDKNIKFYLL